MSLTFDIDGTTQYHLNDGTNWYHKDQTESRFIHETTSLSSYVYLSSGICAAIEFALTATGFRRAIA
jgi:hypothetical protein